MQKKHFICPHCGSDVPNNARACPECGSDEETGWSEGARYAHLLPYNGDEGSYVRSRRWPKRLMAAIAIFVLSAYITASFGGLHFIIPLMLMVGAIYYATEVYPNTYGAKERRAYQKLLQKAMGSQALAERLIEYERQRNPQASRLQLIENSLRRWQLDNR